MSVMQPARATALGAPTPGLLGTALAVALAMGGCASQPGIEDGGQTGGQHAPRFDGPPDAVPRVEPKSRSGNMARYEVRGRVYYTKESSRGFVERGVASWYGKPFHGRKTSSGEVYDMYQMTAAHKTLPLPTYARVTNLDNGASAIVKINDRGPFVDNRVIDLSYAAARRLNMLGKGTGHVEIVSVDPRDHYGVPPGMMLASATAPAQATTASQRPAAARPRRESGSPFEDGPVSRAPATRPSPVVAARAPAPSPATVPPRAAARPAAARSAEPVVAATPPPPTTAPAAVPESVIVAGADRLPPTPVPRAPQPVASVASQPTPVAPAAAPPKPVTVVAAEPTQAPSPKPVVVAAAAKAAPAAPKPAVHQGAKPKAQPAVYLQVGAFGDRGNAEALRKRLGSRFAEPVKVHEPKGGALYKVQVGPLASARADTLRRELKTLGLEAPILIRQ